MSLYKPIFIVGHGRCGSTILHDVLCHHPDVAWFTQFIQKYPDRPYINAYINQCFHNPLLSVLGRYLISKRKIYPVEPYRFWEHHCHGFARPFRDLKSADVFPRVVPAIRGAIDKSIPADKRLIAKITGWPRIGYLKEIFPDAKFIHIVRDGRAVVNSVLAAPYFDGWAGPSQWARGELSERQMDIWNNSKQSFVILAAIGYENRMEAFERAKEDMTDENYLEIKYEEFCENKRNVLEEIVEFLELPGDSTAYFHKSTDKIKVNITNDKWKTDLTEQQRKELDEYLAPVLKKYGYK